MTVFASQLEIVWDNGMQTSHYMSAPNGGTVLTPDFDWHYLHRGATSNAIDFYFNRSGRLSFVRYAIWRTVWIPQHAAMRLVYAQHRENPDGSLIPCTIIAPCPQIVLAEVEPTTTGPKISQDVNHPVDAPRAVDFDITDALNALIASGNQTQIYWQIRAIP